MANQGAMDQSDHSDSLMNSRALNLSDDNIASQGDSRILKDLTRSYHSDDMPSEEGMEYQDLNQDKLDHGAIHLSYISAAAKIPE